MRSGPETVGDERRMPVAMTLELLALLREVKYSDRYLLLMTTDRYKQNCFIFGDTELSKWIGVSTWWVMNKRRKGKISFNHIKNGYIYRAKDVIHELLQ